MTALTLLGLVAGYTLGIILVGIAIWYVAEWLALERPKRKE